MPRLDRAVAMCWPIPRDAPVTIAVRVCIKAASVDSRLPSGGSIILSQDNLARRAAGRSLRTGDVRTERIGQLLFVAAQAAQSLATSRLDQLGLTPREWGVLSTLVESG